MKTYTFECYDSEDRVTTKVEFSTQNAAWSGYDGPVSKFFDFLKGCGFVFRINDQLGIMSQKGDFTSSID